MKIAIIGAGFAGLASAWHLCKTRKAEVVVFDAVGIGGGASGIAAGLLHAYGGPRARLNARGMEGLAATRQLLEVAAEALGQPVAYRTGLYRIPVTEEQLLLYRDNASRYRDVQLDHFHGYESLSISEAYVVDSIRYLEGLWKACEAMGAGLEVRRIQNLADLESFDRILIAAGAKTRHFDVCAQLPLRDLKGQILETTLPEEMTEAVPWTVGAYVVPQLGKKTCIIGATFEREFVDEAPDLRFAEQQLMPEVVRFVPAFEKVKILGCRAALRATAPGYLPLCQAVSEKCWVAAGLGSKGLLYHALLGQEAAFALFNT